MLQRPVVRQLARFVTVGLLNTLTCFTVIFLLRRGLGTSVGVASAGGYGIAMIQGFLLSRYWAFASDDHAVPLAAQAAGFVVVNLICGTLFTQANVWLESAFTRSGWFPSGNWPLLASSVVAQASVIPVSFLLYRLIVFRERS